LDEISLALSTKVFADKFNPSEVPTLVLDSSLFKIPVNTSPVRSCLFFSQNERALFFANVSISIPCFG
jgi:hypothetical protein